MLSTLLLVGASFFTLLPADRPPNIVFILADDLGYGELGCYGQERIETPHIDALASKGMRFTQFYAGNPVCATSRCVLLTGLHSGHAYIRDNREVQPEGQEPIPSESITIAELLKEQGYATAAIGKWGLGFPGSTGDPTHQGFDLFYGYNCQRHAHNHYPRYLWHNNKKVVLQGNSRGLTGAQYSQDLFVEQANRFVTSHQDAPFFLYLSFAVPHLAIQVPDKSLSRYENRIPESPYEHRSGYVAHPSPRAGYAAMVTHMDEGVGSLVATIDKLGLSRNTIILFTSDNGPTYGRLGGADSTFFNSTAGLRSRKGSVYEGGIRVPLVARWTDAIPESTESHHISAFWDLLPTFAELSGASQPELTDGISMVPTLLQRGKQETHDYLYWHFPGYGGQQALRMGPWKAVKKNLRRHPNSPLELYRLDQDKTERNNIADEHPEMVQRIESAMQDAYSPAAFEDWNLPTMEDSPTK